MTADLKKEIDNQFGLFAQKMDARDAYFLQLKEFANKHEYDEIPIEHRMHLEQANSFVPWRDQKKVVNKIKRAALIAAKNKLGLRKEPKRFRKYREERERVAKKAGLA